ncbi:MAG: YciI family protein [Acidimicrobiales bacterium]|nr:YciI family protein [Acidimicrobiales bacterium]
MTQYMLSVWHRGDYDDVYVSEEEQQEAFEAVDKFNNQIMEAGQWVFGGGLNPPDTATVVDNTKGDLVVTDGPFAESKEQLGGFWVIEAKDLDEAMDLAKQASVACKNPVEVRPFQG